MKHVNKEKVGPISFENWKNLINPCWEPRYSDLPNPEKSDLHRSLLIKQGWVCCYCGIGISKEDSHIEHFKPQTKYPEDALSYSNLFASCNGENNKIHSHCGHAKGDTFDADQVISPSDGDCEEQFYYQLDGKINSLTPRAEYMVDLLQLNDPLLSENRYNILINIFDHDFINNATDEDLQKIKNHYNETDFKGAFKTFGHVVSHFAAQLLNHD